jgi:syntaxin 18
LAKKEANPFLRLLPAQLMHTSAFAASEFLAAHNASVTWYLTRRLAQVSQGQKEMQEERVKRQSERARTLGSGAAREAVVMGLGDSVMSTSNIAGSVGRSWLGGASSMFASSLASTIGAPSNATSALSTPQEFDYDSIEDDDDDVELSASQIQQFEAENAQILRAAEDTLASVQQAEARLLEISALQMELITHLTQQSEATDRLYDDAIATTEFVQRGNVQLREARRRAREGKLWLLIFLIGASLSLLFLHYY